MTTAHARNSDPATSHLAAESVKDTSELQRRLLILFEEYGAKTHEEMVELYGRQFGPWWPATESSIRTRIADLRDKTLIVERGTKKNKRNRDAILWDLPGRLF